MLSKLFTRKLKGGIEKQGGGVVGWLRPLQLWGKVGMGVSLQASPPSPPSLQDAHSPAWERRSASAAYTPRNPCLTPVAGGTTTRVAPGASPQTCDMFNCSLALFRYCIESFSRINQHFNALILKEKKAVS